MAGSKAQRLARHKRLHPNDLVAAKATGALTKKQAPKMKIWTRQLKTFAQMAVASGYRGSVVLKEWARGDIYEGRKGSPVAAARKPAAVKNKLGDRKITARA